MRTTELTRLYQDAGPFASVTLDVSHDSEKGAHEHDLRVRAAGEELAATGAEEKVVELVAERLGRPVGASAPVARPALHVPRC